MTAMRDPRLMDRQIRALAKDVSKTRYHVRWDLETWSADAGPFTGSSTMHPDAGVVTIEAADWADAGDTVDNLMDVDFLVNGDPGSMGHTDGWVSCEEPDLDENEREAIGWGRCTFHPRVIETVSVEPHTHDLRPSGGLVSCVTCGWIPSDDELDEPTIDDGTRAALIVTAELAGFGVLTQEQREQIDTRLLSEGGARS